MTEPSLAKTVEDEIKAKAKTLTEWYEERLDAIGRKEAEPHEIDLIEVDDVLAVVNADRAEHNKQLTEAFDKIDSALDWVVPVQHLTIIKELIQKQLAELKL